MTTTTDSSVIERREFTYCSAFYPAELAKPDCSGAFRKFLVMTPSRPEAVERAWQYARGHWGEPQDVNVYPRNYVKQARALYAAGEHDASAAAVTAGGGQR